MSEVRINSWQLEGYSVEETNNVVNVAMQTRGQLPTVDFGHADSIWGTACLIYQAGVKRLNCNQTPMQQMETRRSVQQRLTTQ